MKNSYIILIFLFLIACREESDPKKDVNYQKAIVQLEKTPDLQEDIFFDFENESLGNLPKHWSQSATGRDSSTDWKIVDDHGNKVLAQVSFKHPNYHFNNIVYDAFKSKNMIMEVKLKAVKGRMDQGGGFVWRYADHNNYYVVRANPLEDNVVLYKVVNGKRSDLPVMGKGRTYGVDVPPLGNDWNTLKLTVKDDLFTVFLNGKELFKVQDTTFTGAGKTGLWTKADAVTYFDDFSVRLK